MSRSRIAFVAGTSAPQQIGGAEAVLREMAEGFAHRGWDVDLLSTAATSIYTWENTLPEGTTTEGPLTVRRFNAVGLTQPLRDRLGARILGGDRLELAEQYAWVNSGMRSPGLFDYLADHAGDYRAIVCGPYQFWMALVLADLAPERTILMPCLHDEPFAGLEVYRYQMTSARGLWLLSEPERELAARHGLLGRRVAVIGSGIESPPPVDPDGFRVSHRLDRDFALFCGRREWGKGWPQLLEDLRFATEVLGEPVPLVTCGVGDIGAVPAGAEVIDLGVVTPATRASAQAAATVYIQPSAMESFSRTVLESFSLGTPVIANDASAVVRWHCERSGAGLTYRNRYEFAESLRLIRSDPDALAQLGAAGPAYVAEHFAWPAVLDRAVATIEEWL
ncbi:MAG: glycosyltransferase family 4 protein [Actinomycetota bacterium]|nr:glycosyltransferase family 4 protein [Actinomycetota bacterium]